MNVPVPNKKRLFLALFLMLLIIVSFGIFLFMPIYKTGKAPGIDGISVIREVHQVSEDSFIVELDISSNHNIVAITEFLPGGSDVTDYSMSEEYEIFEFKPSEYTWIIADDSLTINAKLDYTVQMSCSEIDGEFIYLNLDELITSSISGDRGPCPAQSDSTGGRFGGGSSGGSRSSITNTSTPPKKEDVLEQEIPVPVEEDKPQEEIKEEKLSPPIPKEEISKTPLSLLLKIILSLLGILVIGIVLIKTAYIMEEKKSSDMLKKYVDQCKKNGYEDKTINSALVNKGWSKKVIDKVLEKK